MKKLLALILCVALLLSLSGCKNKTPDPAAELAQIKELYTQASDKLSSASHITTEILITTVTTVAGDEFSEQSTQSLTYQGIGTEDAIISMNESLLFNVHTDENTDKEKEETTTYRETWHKGTVYQSLMDTYRFQTAIDQAHAAKRYTPVVLLNSKLYNNATKEATETETTITFSQPTAGESWAMPQDATLVDATGTAKISAEGIVTEMTYAITYQYGAAQVKKTVEAKPAATPLAVSVPSNPTVYAEIADADVLRMTLTSAAKLAQVDSITFNCSEMLISQAAGYVQSQSVQADLYGRKENTIGKFYTTFNTVDYQNKETTVKKEDVFLDNKLTSTVNNGLPSSDSTVTWEDIREYAAQFWAFTAAVPDYWESVTVTDTGFAYLMEFKLNESFGNTVHNNLCTMLWNDPNFLLDMASSYNTKDLSGYMSVDKYTGLPIASGYYYEGAHKIDGSIYTLSEQFDQSITSPSKGAYKEITGKLLPEKEPENKATPLLYKVTGKDGQQMYLFGTIHVGDERTAYLPEAIQNAFKESDVLAIECNNELFEQKVKDDDAFSKQVSELYFLQGSTMETLLDEQYKEAYQYLKAVGGNNANMLYAKPFAWEETISACYLHLGYQLHSDFGAEERLIAWAKEQNKEIREIESAMQQLKMFSGFSEKLQVYMLTSTIETNAQEYAKEVMALYEKWCAGDEAALREAIASDWEPTEEEKAELQSLYDEYYAKMDTDRNKGMLDAAIEYLEGDQVVFYAVGMAHLLDENTGLVDALRQAGYTVEKVAY